MSPAEKSKVRAAAWKGGVRVILWGVGGGWGRDGVGMGVWGETYVSDEGCCAGGAGEEVEPFFGLEDVVSKVWLMRWGEILIAYVRVPVQFPQRSWLECYDRRSNGFRHGEVARVDDLDGAAASGCDFGLKFACAENVGAVAFEFAEGGVGGCGGGVGFEDVRVGRGDGVEDGCVDACGDGWSVGLEVPVREQMMKTYLDSSPGCPWEYARSNHRR